MPRSSGVKQFGGWVHCDWPSSTDPEVSEGMQHRTILWCVALWKRYLSLCLNGRIQNQRHCPLFRYSFVLLCNLSWASNQQQTWHHVWIDCIIVNCLPDHLITAPFVIVNSISLTTLRIMWVLFRMGIYSDVYMNMYGGFLGWLLNAFRQKGVSLTIVRQLSYGCN